MPEGPEIHYAADQLNAALSGAPLREARFLSPALAAQAKRLKGRRVLRVEARGKALLTQFDHGWTLYTHNHLLGFWKIVDSVDELTSPAVPRVMLRAENRVAALYAAPTVQMVRTTDVEAIAYVAKLGPDVLDPDTTRAEVLAQVRDARFGRRPLAVLLLDQAFVAGMGNYLRSEVLFKARLSPHRIASSLSASESRMLSAALLDVPRRSYRAKHAVGVAADADYLEHTQHLFRLQVFEREGLACPRCGGNIVNERIAARRLYWCVRCQA